MSTSWCLVEHLEWANSPRAKFYGWRFEDALAAHKEGWKLIDVIGGVSITNTSTKMSYEEANEHVQARALQGSSLHERAWAIYVKSQMERKDA